MNDLAKKVCMIGDFAVGKTSLVRRFVSGIFDERYLTTVGVNISTKIVSLADHDDVKMVIWDIAGDANFQPVTKSYIRGAAGFLIVADGTRRSTFESALTLKSEIDIEFGATPCIMLLNKSDLVDDWRLDDNDAARIEENGLTAFKTSAKTGNSVEDAFTRLTQAMVNA